MRVFGFYRVVQFLALFFLVGCGGGGGGGTSPSTTPTPPVQSASSLPPLTSLRSDLLDPTEGTSANPLKVAPCMYPIAENIVGQRSTCGNPNLVYAQSNSFRTGDTYFTWRVPVNNEPSWDWSENTGPPNQSKALDGRPFSLTSTENAITLRLDADGFGDNGGKIPYFGIAYVRGAQGDPVSRIGAWGTKPTLTFTASMKKIIAPESPTSQWLHIWFIFRAANGDRIMLLHEASGPSGAFGGTCMWPSTKAEDGCYLWNWPAKNSYYYPGAWLMRGEGGGTNIIVDEKPTQLLFDVEAIARKIFPQIDTIAPDFVGFEIAIEQGYQAIGTSRMTTEVTISDITLR